MQREWKRVEEGLPFCPGMKPDGLEWDVYDPAGGVRVTKMHPGNWNVPLMHIEGGQEIETTEVVTQWMDRPEPPLPSDLGKKPSGSCLHEGFRVVGRVYRHPDEDTGVITSYSIDVEVQCHICKVPFQFLGMNTGSPGVGLTGGELRLGIKPGLRGMD